MRVRGEVRAGARGRRGVIAEALELRCLFTADLHPIDDGYVTACFRRLTHTHSMRRPVAPSCTSCAGMHLSVQPNSNRSPARAGSNRVCITSLADL
jgi:hypothetical protein